MNSRIDDRQAGAVVSALIDTISKNAAYLSEIDGAIGDGDHGINMNKGFTLCRNKLEGRNVPLSEGLAVLSSTLMDEIGGSMGPLYGVFFDEMSAAAADSGYIDGDVFQTMLKNTLAGVMDIGSAKQGDKTLLDTLIPAVEAYTSAWQDEADFIGALTAMKQAAKSGWESTRDMVAKVGRASRLGERSRGVLDAGATSCYLLLAAMADSLMEQLA